MSQDISNFFINYLLFSKNYGYLVRIEEGSDLACRAGTVALLVVPGRFKTKGCALRLGPHLTLRTIM